MMLRDGGVFWNFEIDSDTCKTWEGQRPCCPYGGESRAAGTLPLPGRTFCKHFLNAGEGVVFEQIAAPDESRFYVWKDKRMVNASPVYDVWALSSGGRRIASVPAERIGGCLDFTADVARDKDSATWLYEIVRRDGR